MHNSTLSSGNSMPCISLEQQESGIIQGMRLVGWVVDGVPRASPAYSRQSPTQNFAKSLISRGDLTQKSEAQRLKIANLSSYAQTPSANNIYNRNRPWLLRMPSSTWVTWYKRTSSFTSIHTHSSTPNASTSS